MPERYRRHPTVNPAIVPLAQQLARELFWMTVGEVEPAKERAREVLKTLVDSRTKEPLTDEQVEAVLHGDARLEGKALSKEEVVAVYVAEEDREFKPELRAIKESYVEAAGRRVHSSAVEQYARVKGSSRSCWNNILKEAGFYDKKRKRVITYKILTVRNGRLVKDSSEYQNFKEELTGYINDAYH